MSPLPGDAASVSVRVRVAPADAFDVFTTEIDQWWRTGPAYRIAGRRRGQLYFEPGQGGRLFETFEASKGSRTVQVGKITRWEPPRRFALEWRGVNYAPSESTVVEVTFEAQGDGTLVTVRHSGFASLRDGHPVRHGEAGAVFTRRIGMWWADLMRALREHVERDARPATGD